MIRNLYTRLVFIVIIAALAIWVDIIPEIQIRNPIMTPFYYERKIAPRLGLDLQGGCRFCSKLTCLPSDNLMRPRWKQPAPSLKTARTPWA
jgi:preprotein translocase subunit SecD